MSGERIKNLPVICNGHSRPVVDLRFSQDASQGAMLLSCSKDSKSMIRDAYTGDWLGSFIGHKGCVWCCRFNIDSTLVATGSADFSARVWDVNTGKSMVDIPHNHIVRSLDFSSILNKPWLLTGDGKNTLNVFDMTKPDSPLFSKNITSGTIRRLQLADDDRKLFTLTDKKQLCLWDTNSFMQDPALSFSHGLTGSTVEFRIQTKPNSPLVKLLVANSNLAEFMTFDIRSPAKKGTNEISTCSHYKIQTKSAVSSVAIHPTTDEFVLCGCEDGMIYRIATETSEELDACKGHFGAVHCVDFAPFDGRLFASGSEDGTVRLWQTNPGEEFGLWRLKAPVVNENKEVST